MYTHARIIIDDCVVIGVSYLIMIIILTYSIMYNGRPFEAIEYVDY